MHPLRTLLCLVLLAGGLAACTGGDSESAAPAEPATSVAAPEAATGGGSSPVMARVGESEIRLDDVNERIRDELFEREMGSLNPSEKYERQASAVASLVETLVLERAAAEKGLGVDAFLRGELESVGGVTESEIAVFYAQNQERLPTDQGLDELSPAIRSFIEQQKLQQIRAQIREQAAVQILIEPPRVKVAGRGHQRGPEGAPITLVEFSDYQCPFCLSVEPTIAQLLELYPDKILLEYRHLPLEQIHPRARPAAVAAICAEGQGKFWDYHQKLFENQRALGEEDLARYASELELDSGAFQSCRENSETASRIDADIAAANGAGISGTPAFLVNGILLSGARPLEDFVRVIDAELAGGG